MFRLPKNLFENFNRIKYCDLVKNKVHTDEALREFESCLNEAQPISDSDTQLELFTKNLYRGKPEMFVNLIKNRNSECLVLWTESKQIVRFFQLYGFIYIQYDKDTHQYKVLKHRRLTDPASYQENSRNYNNHSEDYPILSGENVPGNADQADWSRSNPDNSFRSKLVSSLLDEVIAPTK
jgi:hypothetical protein